MKAGSPVGEGGRELEGLRGPAATGAPKRAAAVGQCCVCLCVCVCEWRSGTSRKVHWGGKYTNHAEAAYTFQWRAPRPGEHL